MGPSLLLFLQTNIPQKIVPRYPRVDATARQILEYTDWQTVAFTILVMLVVFLFLGRCVRGRWAAWDDLFHSGVALLTAISGTTIAVVLLFTEPPAFDKLTTESRWIPAAVTLAFTVRLCCLQFHKTFFKD
jgi:hypothetical protein